MEKSEGKNGKDMAKKVSDKLKKDIRYVEVKGHYYDEVGTGLYLFKHSSSKSIDDGKENHMVFRISESCTLMKNYKFTIKSGFLSHKNAEIDLYSLEFRLF